MKTVDENKGTNETKNECMRATIRCLCLEELSRMMMTDPEVREAICAEPERSIWFVLDPQSLKESEPIEWIFMNLDSCFMLEDSRCGGEDPRSVGAIQVELKFGTPKSEGERHSCEWEPWWASLRPEEMAELRQTPEPEAEPPTGPPSSAPAARPTS